MLSATPPPPPALILLELFQYILNNTRWVIVVVKAAGQISKQETGKSAEIIPIKWDWMMENKGRGTWEGHSWSRLHTAACFDCSDLTKKSWRLKVKHSSWFYHSRGSSIFSPVHRCYQRSPGDWTQLWGIMLRWSLHADGPRVRSCRGLRIHTGAAAISLACRPVLMLGRWKWSVIFGWQSSPLPLSVLSSSASGIDSAN